MDPDTKQRVVAWCREEGLLREELTDPKARWHVRTLAPAAVARSIGGHTLDVLDVRQALEEADKVVVYAGVDFDQAILDGMRKLEMGELVHILELTLESRPEAFVLDYADGVLRSILVLEEIYLDGLTKDRFMRALRGVHKSMVLALWTLRPALEAIGVGLQIEEGQPPPPPAEPAAERYCAQCGAALRVGARFCTKCGTRDESA